MRCTRLTLAIEIEENVKKLFVKLLIQSSLCLWELKAMTGFRHCCLSFAFFLSSYQLILFTRIFSSTLRRQVSLGLPLALLTGGV